MIKLINNLTITDLKDANRFMPLEENRYQVIKSTYLNGYYLYASDIIRLESVSVDQLIASKAFLNNAFSNSNRTVSLYHLDTATLKHYTYEDLEVLF